MVWLDRSPQGCHGSGTGQTLLWFPSTGTGAPLDLDLDIASVVGRKARSVDAEVLRELTKSDLALLATERGIKPSHIARLSDRHHSLARCLATGLSVADSCAITGYTPSRVSILRGDPSFEELISFYQGGKAELLMGYAEKAAVARNMATDLIIERMDDEPEKVSTGEALDIAKTFADRSGHGPASRTTNVHVHVGTADRLKQARLRTLDLIPLAPAADHSKEPS